MLGNYNYPKCSKTFMFVNVYQSAGSRTSDSHRRVKIDFTSYGRRYAILPCCLFRVNSHVFWLLVATNNTGHSEIEKSNQWYCSMFTVDDVNIQQIKLNCIKTLIAVRKRFKFMLNGYCYATVIVNCSCYSENMKIA